MLRHGQTTRPDPAKEGYTLVTGRCQMNGKEHTVSVPTAGIFKWNDGMHIQDAMPETSAEDREFLISGISPTGWTEMFGSGEDEEEDEL